MAQTNKPWYKKWWAIALFIVIGLAIIGSFLPDTDTSTQQTNNVNQEQEETPNTNTKSVSIGEEGRLYLEGESVVPVCKTKEYFDELIDAAVANDEIGYKQILTSGKCYVASILDDLEGDYYGRVLVLDRTIGASKFRFVHPDALHYGETAWTNVEFIIPIE